MLCQLVIPSVLFFNIFFIALMMNIKWERMLTNLDNSPDDYNSHLQKLMILQVIQHIYREMLIGGKNCEQWCVFLVINTRTNVQNDSSEFEGIIHEMVSLKPFSNQEICHIDLNGEKIYMHCVNTHKRILEHSRNWE